MADRPNDEAARWVPLLVVGISLNTLGIALPASRGVRFAFMGAGLLLLLVSLAKIISAAKDRGDPPRQGQVR